jgi:uncharacterized protein YodC (DUF2158 family)
MQVQAKNGGPKMVAQKWWAENGGPKMVAKKGG